MTQSMCGSGFFSTARSDALHQLLVLRSLHVSVSHVPERTGEEAPRAAGWVEDDFAWFGIDAVRP